jgi:hypothetical protein
MSTPGRLVYALLFQLGWLVCICLGSLAALGYTLLFTLLHFAYLNLISTGHNNLKELSWLASVTFAGFAMETLFFSAGVLYMDFADGLFVRLQIPPLWLFALWVCFAIALRSCLAFCLKHILLGHALFAMAVPASYLAGTSLNASVHINKPYALSLLLITLSWMIFLGGLQLLQRRYFGDFFYDR